VKEETPEEYHERKRKEIFDEGQKAIETNEKQIAKLDEEYDAYLKQSPKDLMNNYKLENMR
jgi:hypothetical protein